MTTATLSIRSLGAEDREAWLPLWRGYQEFYRVSLSEAVTDLTWAHILDAASSVTGLGAFQDGALIGIAHIVRYLSTWHEGDAAYLQDLFVAPEVRCSGAGSALIEAAATLAAQHGAPRLHWLTHETNARAIRLYEHVGKRSGFVQYVRVVDGPE